MRALSSTHERMKGLSIVWQTNLNLGSKFARKSENPTIIIIILILILQAPLGSCQTESCKIYYYMMSQNKLIRRDDHNTQSVTKSTMISRADQLVRTPSQLFYVTSVI